MESEDKFGRVVPSSKSEAVQDVGQPVVSDEFGGLETGRWWRSMMSGDSTVGWGGG